MNWSLTNHQQDRPSTTSGNTNKLLLFQQVTPLSALHVELLRSHKKYLHRSVCLTTAINSGKSGATKWPFNWLSYPCSSQNKCQFPFSRWRPIGWYSCTLPRRPQGELCISPCAIISSVGEQSVALCHYNPIHTWSTWSPACIRSLIAAIDRDWGYLFIYLHSADYQFMSIW